MYIVELKGHDDHDTFYIRSDNCDACDDRSYGDSVNCLECDFNVHLKCTFVFGILETKEHLSHVGHCLKLLTTGAPDHTDPKCHICGNNTKRLLYHCSTCKLNLDIDCMLNDMFARAPINMPWHRHPLVKLDSGHYMFCEVCGRHNGYGYFCPTCKLMVHDKCVSVFDSPEIANPFHTKHSLKLLTGGAPSYTDSKCHLCGEHIENFLYHCVTCKFNLDMASANEDHNQHKLPPVVLSNTKVHEDTLTLIPRLISFVCDACGMKGDRSPYVSPLQGGDHMFFHQKCARLPRVIHVNRHDHRVSYKYPLGHGEWKCEICLEDIDWSCGAYSCSLCPDYVLHSNCATREDVWDGEELDGVLEEVEDWEPFKLNDDNTITHFAHEHHRMSLNREGKALAESILCEACVCPIASNTFYNCLSCNFIMHETCANLQKKKRLFLSPIPLSLERQVSGSCEACFQICLEGFMYTDGTDDFDLVCCSITVPFIHESHKHPLLYMGTNDYLRHSCQNCGDNSTFKAEVLGCIKCNYYLDFRCATLPLTVRLLRYDDHPLTLCYGEEETSGKYWCDACETEVNPKKWFYTCNDCSVTLHIFCAFGNMTRYVKPGKFFNFELMLNKTSTRPICYNCQHRCVGPYSLISSKKSFCSHYCRCRNSNSQFSGAFDMFSPPPWINQLNT